MIEQNWHRRPSELSGYNRTMYTTANNGDYLRVDYNLSENKVRLYVEIASEGGKGYYSLIEDGKIILERDLTSNSSTGLSYKFRSRAKIFSTINHREVFKLIKGHYGIGRYSDRNANQESRDDIRRKYFQTSQKVVHTKRRNPWQIFKAKVGWYDFWDFFGGLAVLFLLFYTTKSYIFLGVSCATWGILSGAIDIYLRERPTLFIKVITLLTGGIAIYIYGNFIK